MPQLHLYVQEKTASKIRQIARLRGLSVSRLLADLVSREVPTEWPDWFFIDVAGGWQGERLERSAQGVAEHRDSL
ncbi:MAG: hypothetical protein MUE60_03285 [Candidatus Eisenbacteria bacterium]|jgi:hypothetical protein|nr:hypothetical protein [Candidatus Eisenbacteria bacterium]